ncbi:MAG: hypothetical protein L6R37_003536 [Teloschistes peruensis]|nr:MAG: hypothetical protein L6R37_003536 [Teloschistes peruensis]
MVHLEAGEECAAHLVKEISTCYLQLSQSSSLSPSPQINDLFQKLVLMHPRIVDITTPLRCLCSDGEFELERYWAEQVLQKESQEEDLIRMEMNALASSVTKPRLRKFAVIGSGPLPLTSICLSRLLSGQGGAFVHNIDRDPWAISTSAQLCARLGYTLEQMRFQCADVHDQRLDLYGSDVVYLAGLVGINEDDKQEAISRIARQMSPGALLILRSAHSLRGLLYPVSFGTRFLMA